MHNKVRIINQDGFSSSSLALQPCKFGTCFPHTRCPFCSAQVLLLHLFTLTFLRSYSTSFIHLRLGSPFFSPSAWSVFQLLFYRPCTIHFFNMPNLFQSTYFNYRVCYKFLSSFLFSKPHFHMLVYLFCLIAFLVRTVTASIMNYEPYTTDSWESPSREFRDRLVVQMQHVTKYYTRPRIFGGFFPTI
jgi:hypothetical protein